MAFPFRKKQKKMILFLKKFIFSFQKSHDINPFFIVQNIKRSSLECRVHMLLIFVMKKTIFERFVMIVPRVYD